MRAFTLWILVWLTGCVAYNEQCQALVENPNEKVAILAKELWLDRPNTRHAPNALGQAEADSFVDVFAPPPGTDGGVDFAVVNGGALRAEGLCGTTRNILPVTAIGLTNGVLHEILLFENLVDAVNLTEPEVIAVFEHSAERLFPAPTPIASPAGSFLQVSKEVELVIDCSKPPLSRVTSLKIGGKVVTKPGSVNTIFRIALVSFLLGGDGYTMLAGIGQDPTRFPAQAQRFGGVDSNITADYLRRTYLKEPGLQLDPAAPRVVLQNCTQAVRPAN